MRQTQTQLLNFRPSTNPFLIEASTIQFNSTGKPKRRQGRRGNYLTAPELTEIIQGFYFSRSKDDKQRILQKYGQKKIRHGLAICRLDLGKQGRIIKYKCGLHGSKYLVYSSMGYEDGCRVRCFVEGGCRTNTHFDSYLFRGTDRSFAEQSENE